MHAHSGLAVLVTARPAGTFEEGNVLIRSVQAVQAASDTHHPQQRSSHLLTAPLMLMMSVTGSLLEPAQPGTQELAHLGVQHRCRNVSPI